MREARGLEDQMWVEYRAHREIDEDILNKPLNLALNEYVEEEYNSGRWSSVTTYNNWKYTVKLVSKHFGKKKVKDIKEKDVRGFARDYVRTHNTKVAPHTTLDR